MKYSEKDLRSYIERCFKDAFKSEGRDYNNKLYSFEWIMIKNLNGIYQLYPIIECRFITIVEKVICRLKNNLMKNFGIHYGNTDNMRCLLCSDGQIDFNFTRAMFNAKGKNWSLSILDAKTNVYENGLSGECMVAYTYEKLLFKYWGLDAESYEALQEDDKRTYLPESLSEDWEGFKDLYNRTFDIPIGSDYDIIYSSGIKLM